MTFIDKLREIAKAMPPPPPGNVYVFDGPTALLVCDVLDYADMLACAIEEGRSYTNKQAYLRKHLAALRAHVEGGTHDD